MLKRLELLRAQEDHKFAELNAIPYMKGANSVFKKLERRASQLFRKLKPEKPMSEAKVTEEWSKMSRYIGSGGKL